MHQLIFGEKKMKNKIEIFECGYFREPLKQKKSYFTLENLGSELIIFESFHFPAPKYAHHLTCLFKKNIKLYLSFKKNGVIRIKNFSIHFKCESTLKKDEKSQTQIKFSKYASNFKKKSTSSVKKLKITKKKGKT